MNLSTHDIKASGLVVESYSRSGESVQGSETSVKVLLRIEVQTDPMFDPNDPRTMSKLSEEMEKKLHISRPFSLTWKTQKDGKVFQEVSQKKKAARKCN
ncbi:hypothetical protein G5714_005096 [Onychostoma macrolepis]|uniref:Uncharacterized protein n=1 Tax=Onychostoma macrolepis TaxID=369639 RepID=A0A7J6D6I0_9TELE|nr:hypothetical protein G5714_005096 [Onychostoma macrolepis]